MLKKIIRRTARITIRPIAVRIRRFMQAEVVHEIIRHRGHEAAAYERSLEAALLTIALHQDQTDNSNALQSDTA